MDRCIQMIMVGSVAVFDHGWPGGREVTPAVTVVTPRSGSDLEYYLNRVGGEKTAGGYYLNAAQQGEPPGRWFGKGAEALGFADGQTVERDPYLAVYQQADLNAVVGYPREKARHACRCAVPGPDS